MDAALNESITDALACDSILDCDTMVKLLYGHQAEAEVVLALTMPLSFLDFLVKLRRFCGWALRPFFISGMNIDMDVRILLEQTLPAMGYELVDLELTRSGGFRVFIDKPEGITVDDCVLVSNHLSRVMMVENIDYDRLEISSPGLDRPLKKEADFVRFTGARAKIKTRVLVGLRKQFVGDIVGVVDGNVLLLVEGETLAIPFSNVDKARLDPSF